MLNLNEYSGCIHGHSVYSDGSGTYPEIIHAAREAGLDFLMMSDHMTLEGKHAGFEGWHDDLFLSIGYEINDPEDKHHYLVFGLNEVLPPKLSHTEYIKAVQAQGAFGIAAHPFENRDSIKALRSFPPIPWGNLDYPEIKAIEIWNMMSHWMESTTFKNLFWNLVHPRSFSTFPSRRLRKWWDGANKHRKVVGIGSVDVHAMKIKILGVLPKAIFHYKIMFKSIRTHILTEKVINRSMPVAEVENILFETLQSGRSFVSNFRRGDAAGFRFWAEIDDRYVQMGESDTAKKVRLCAQIPRREKCKLIRDGEIYKTMNTSEIDLIAGPGVYRLEVEKQNRGWIYTNHIKIKG